MLSLVIASILTADPPKPTAAWTPKDKEMVVLLGSAFIEQEARDGYLETELIRLFPNNDIRVRNLGWSGDTVQCQARGYFGGPQEGFERLRGHLQMIKPTTVICCYGANESWKGDEGVPDFRKGYERLIDMIRQATGATVVLVTPPKFEPLPLNKGLIQAEINLVRYSQEVKYIAEGRGCILNDFARRFPHRDLSGPRTKATENGVTFSTAAYASATGFFWDFAGEPITSTTVDFRKKELQSRGTKTWKVITTKDSIRWTQQDERLPSIFYPGSVIVVNNADGELGWRIDGTDIRPDARTTRDVRLVRGTGVKQTDQLRHAIIKKNALFFHRWRPANETYLYGFRKHEQGNNGVEPPQFDKLVEQAEAEIARLKKPAAHRYELVRVPEKK